MNTWAASCGPVNWRSCWELPAKAKKTEGGGMGSQYRYLIRIGRLLSEPAALVLTSDGSCLVGCVTAADLPHVRRRQSELLALARSEPERAQPVAWLVACDALEDHLAGQGGCLGLRPCHCQPV